MYIMNIQTGSKIISRITIMRQVCVIFSSLKIRMRLFVTTMIELSACTDISARLHGGGFIR